MKWECFKSISMGSHLKIMFHEYPVILHYKLFLIGIHVELLLNCIVQLFSLNVVSNTDLKNCDFEPELLLVYFWLQLKN